jgi:hypothetical protein
MGGFGILDFPSPSAPKPSRPALEADPKEAERQRRLEALERKRRSLSGTITTSPRGLLALSDWAPKRKSLLGE